MSEFNRYTIASLCDMEKGTSPTMKTLPGKYQLVVTAEFRRSSDAYQFDTEAVCIPLVSSTGHGNAALHRVHYQSGKFALANLLVALIPRDHSICLPKYLYYLLQAEKDHLLVPLMQGTANVSLNPQDIENIELLLPDIERQKRIVQEVDNIVLKLNEYKKLNGTVQFDERSLLISMSHRNDLSEKDKTDQGWKLTKLADVLTQVSNPVDVEMGELYPHFGIYSFAKGLFAKPPLDGSEIKAKKLYRVESGYFIYGRLNAYEGAFGVVTDELDGAHVSNEFPTFQCDDSRITPEFLMAYFSTPVVWENLKRKVTGIGGGAGNRRIRLKESVLLAEEIWLPPLGWQQKIKQVSEKLAVVRTEREKNMQELDALLPAILDKAFKGML